MPHSSSKDPGNIRESSDVSQSGSFDTKSLLLELIQTDAGADDLANALKDRQIRDVLKLRNVEVRTTADVGYNCLPIELRDQIRGYFIADLERHEKHSPRCKCCPRMSDYACIDTEWRAAIESVTFRSIRISTGKSEVDIDEDLESFARYVVGNRRRSLRHVRLPVVIPSGHQNDDGEEKIHILINPIRRLFNWMKQWHDFDTRRGEFHLELERFSPLYTGWTDPDRQYANETWNETRNKFYSLPMAPRVTKFSFDGYRVLGIEVFLAMLSRLPRLRHLSIERSDLDFKPWEKRNGGKKNRYPLQLFFTTLSQTVPSLETLKTSTKMDYMDSPMPEYRKALISYSQKLCKMSLKETNLGDALDCFSPFCAEKFDAHAPPLLSWPNLTTLKIKSVFDCKGKEETAERLNKLMVVIGRAVRHLPLIQSLRYTHKEVDHRWRETKFDFLVLTVSRDYAFGRPRAELLITPGWADSEWKHDVVETVVSEEVTGLWTVSLLEGANAVLNVRVELENDAGGIPE